MAGDQLLEVDGAPATPKALNDALAARKPGETLDAEDLHGTTPRLESKVTLAGNRKQAFTLRPLAAPTALQKAILEDWLRRVR